MFALMQASMPPPGRGKSAAFTQGRLLVRLLAEMQVSAVAAGIRAFDGDLDRSILFMVVARESESLPARSAGHAGAGERAIRAISINGLAASLGRPFETVRRHIHALCAQGLCERTRAGVIVPPEVQAQPVIRALAHLHHDLLVRLIEDMADFDLPLPEQRRQADYDWRIGLAAAHDMLLTEIEFHGPRYARWIDMMIIGAVKCANARPFTYDRDISLSYADFDRLPDAAMRQPVSTGAIARALGVPSSTTHRRVSLLLTQGQLVRRPGGLMVADAELNDPQRLEDVRVASDHIRQILIRLAASGFCFDNPSQCYVDGRPPLLPFD